MTSLQAYLFAVPFVLVAAAAAALWLTSAHGK